MVDRPAHLDHGSTLLLHIAAGDERAFAELFRGYERHVRLRIVRHTAKRWSANLEDATQEVFLRIWRQRSAYKPGAPGLAYLYGIADRVASEWFRHERRWERARTEALDGQAATPQSDDLSVPERRADEGESSQWVGELLSRLSEKQRDAVRMCWLEDRSASAAAGALGCTVDTLKKRLRSARRRLKSVLLTLPLWLA